MPYIEDAIAQNIFSISEVDNMLIDSNFCKTIPTDLLESLITKSRTLLDVLPKFTEFVIDKLDSSDKTMLRRLFREDDFFDTVNDRFLSKLIEHPIDDLIDVQGFKYTQGKVLSKKIVESENYTLEEIKKFMVESHIDISIIVDLFCTLYLKKETEEEKNFVISTFIDCINEFCDKLDDSKNHNKLYKTYSEGYKEFAFQIHIICSDVMKDKIAENIYSASNVPFMLAWISSESIKSCEMIDYLVNSSSVNAVKTLNAVPATLFMYVINQVMNKGFQYTSEVLGIVLDSVESYPINTIDSMLEFVLEKYPEFRFSDKSAEALIKAGSMYTNFLLHNYEFSKEQRLEIYNHYKNNGFDDLLALYGGYLVTGNTSRIITSNDVDVDLSALKRNKKPETNDVK